MNEEVVFFEALHRPAAERASFLDNVCGANPVFRQEVEALLLAHEGGADRLQHIGAVIAPAFAIAHVAEAIGTVIGSYKLLEQIGEGGFGVVYVAEQIAPVRRKVALKLLKPGMDSRQVIARFEAERQALALMDHPNIARVLDVGTTESGRPYFVMELVKGVAITEFCEQKQLDMRDRLQLFIDVCHAVQHAHQKGVIHRDLKPSNVLVSQVDGKPVAKVIDFGIAKATGQQLTDKTLYTAFAQLIGTPLYMSPEQAALSGVDVDTRSDVYSLGVMLYEILTGTTPFTREMLSQAGYDELRRIIREEDPPRPSTRVSTLNAQAGSTIATRQPASVQRLNRQLRNELDWIVMKALEKDRNRRYESANALAADVERYLNDEPIDARPPTASYRLRKLARKHRGAAVTTGLVTVALVGGATVAVWQAIRATEARQVADERLKSVNRERKQAEDNFQAALEAVDKMLVVASEQLQNVPQAERARRQLLNDAVSFFQRFLEDHAEDPHVRFQAATAYRKIGALHLALHEFEAGESAYGKAIEILQRLSQSDGEQTKVYEHELADAFSKRSLLLCEAGKLDRAEQDSLQAVAIERRLAAAVPDKYQHWLAGRLNNLGIVLAAQGRTEDALKANDESLSIRSANWTGDRVHGIWFESYSNGGRYLANLGRFAEAEQSYRKALEVQKKLLARSPNNQHERARLASAHLSLAETLQKAGRQAEAEEHAARGLEVADKLATDFPAIPDHRGMVAHGLLILTDGNERQESEPLIARGIEVSQQLASQFPTNRDYQFDLSDFLYRTGRMQLAAGRPTEARAKFEKALEILKALKEPRPIDLSARHEAALNVAMTLVATGQLDDAIAAYRAESPFERSIARASSWLSWQLSNDRNVNIRRPAEALELARKAVELEAKDGGMWTTLAAAEYRMGHWHAAIAASEKAMELGTGGHSGNWLFLAMTCWQLDQKDQAREWFNRAAKEMENAPYSLEMQRLRAEADALLNGTGSSTTKPARPEDGA